MKALVTWRKPEPPVTGSWRPVDPIQTGRGVPACFPASFTTPVKPSTLDFSDPLNSQYLPLVFRRF